jgi:hypothetical protein
MERKASELKGIERVAEHQWAFYDDVLAAVKATGEKFALGGAFAAAAYTGMFRNTKDIDLYVPPESKDVFIHAVTDIGATDYSETLAYDRGWIYRSTRDGYIADLIWSMANYVQPLYPDYFNGKTTLLLRGEHVPVLPAEELILNKLYIMQRTRCDWFDVFNILYCTNGTLDWDRLISRMGTDSILLTSALNVFAWLCPGRVRLFPEDIWEKLRIEKPLSDGPEVIETRVNYLDSRPWFIPALRPGERPFAEGD